MKHPQPGVGCGPCPWGGGGGGGGGAPTHAHTRPLAPLGHTTDSQHTLAGTRGNRKDMKFGKATDRCCHSFINNKCFNVDLQKLTREKETLTVNNSSDAIRKYCAAFPPLLKDDSSDHRLSIMPPPSWCRKPLESSENKSTLSKDGATASREWLQAKSRKSNNQKIRRNSYHGQRKNSTSKRRCHSFSKSSENETLPEWVTHEGVWDMETQDPVKEFIKALAMDEGYGTCENTMTDDTVTFKFNALECSNIERCGNAALDSNFFKNEDLISSTEQPTEEESLAKFKAKFDRSLEALWSRDQANTPDDECQELPVDFQELLSSPCDDLNAKYVISQTCGRSIWSTSSDHTDDYVGQRTNIWSYDAAKEDKVCATCDESAISQECMEIIYDKLRPLNLRDEESPNSIFPSLDLTQSSIVWEPLKGEKPDGNLWSDEDADCEPSSLYQYNEAFDSLPSVTNVMRSLTALNHNKQLSSFTEVIPKWPTGYIGDGRPGKVSSYSYADSKYRERFGVVDQKDEEDLLNSMKTHFQPIKQENGDASSGNVVNYVDGMTFSIMSDLEEVKFNRSQSGTMFLESDSDPPKQYMEYRAKLTDKINFKNNSKVFCDEIENEFVLKFQVRQIEKAVQTDGFETDGERTEATPAKKPLLSSQTAERISEFPSVAANELLGVNRINVNAEEAELVKIQNDKLTKELWKGCEDCKFEDIWKFSADSSRSDVNISKIWSAEDGVCRTCGGGESAVRASNRTPGGRAAKEESREWDELLSDISLARAPRNRNEREAGCDGSIAPAEISFSAPDGNFVERALEYLRGRREVSGASPPRAERTADERVHSEDAASGCCEAPWRCDRKRRHSATGRGLAKVGAGGKLAALRSAGGCRALGSHCPLSALGPLGALGLLPCDAPFLSCCSADRPLTR